MSIFGNNKGVGAAIIVAALGYFVDIYDLILFGVVRVTSLNGIGITSPQEITRLGEMLINSQMVGMLLGGLLWGILGDKKGRLSVLFGSILMYSVANIANGFVSSIESYIVWRFIAGIGLAGELGAGITLVSEIMPKETRGYGTTIVASFGLLGAIAAGLIGKLDWGISFGGEIFDNWRVAYIVGGILGIGLLLLRIGVYESGMFEGLRNAEVKKGDFTLIIFNKIRLRKYIKCILIGLPLWFVIGVLIIQAPEFARALGVIQPSDVDSLKKIAPNAIMLAYAGLAIGDIASGFISQMLKSRKKSLAIFLILTLLFGIHYLTMGAVQLTYFYSICFALGFSVGYWAVFVTVGSEQFGTNLRSTVTTTVPNFVRGALVPLTLTFSFLRDRIFISNDTSSLKAGLVVLVGSMAIAFIALYFLEETFGKDLDYYE